MGLLKKRGSVDIIDIPALQKKGILKRAGYGKYEEEMNKSSGLEGIKITSGFVDFTSVKGNPEETDLSSDIPNPFLNSLEGNSGESSIPTPPSSQDNSPFGMLDILANANSSPGAPSFFSGSSEISNSSSASGALTSLDTNSLKIKMDDLEYKLERLMEKIAKIEEHLRG